MRWLTVVAAVVVSVALPAQAPFVATESLRDARMTFDEARRRLVFALPNGSIWEWDGVNWGQTLATAPYGEMTYDPVRQRVFIVSHRTYEYDGFDVVDRGPAPAPHEVIADTVRGRLIGLCPVIGGGVRIHEYDGSGWTPVGSILGQRTALSGAFDRARGVAVFQTALANQGVTAETWEWDGSSASGPFTLQAFGSCAWDATRQQVLSISTGTWAWNGATWRQLPTTRQPAGGSVGSDPRNGRIWLFGRGQTPDGIWFWDGTGWSGSLQLPHPEVGGQVTHDSARARVVLLGNSRSTWGLPCHFEWDGRRWREQPIGVGPPSFLGHAQAYDAARGETVVFGGRVQGSSVAGETWAFKRASWRLAATTGPAARSGGAMTFDSARGVVVLVGGADRYGREIRDHWMWDGVNWSQVSAAIPFRSDLGALGYDPLRDRLVFVGQAERTYEYDGTAWSLVATGTPRAGLPLVWDPNRQRLQGALFGALSFQARFEWDGTAWLPRPERFGSIAFDQAAGHMVNWSLGGMLLETAAPAVARAYGSGCGGSATTISLAPFGRPRLGGSEFHLDVRADAALRPVIVGLGLARASVPLGNGCTLLLRNRLGSFVWFTDAFGFLHQPLSLPATPSLAGITVHAQAGVLNPASPSGFVMTQGLTLTVGN